MSKKDKDTTWKGKKFLEHVGEVQRVNRSTSREELDHFRNLLERFSDPAEAIPGEFRASVLSDTGQATEFTGKDRETLWKKLSVHLLSPEASWLEFTVFQPSKSLSGQSEFRFENRNVSTVTLETDGTRLVRSVSVALKQGTPPPAIGRTSLVEWLRKLKADCSVPLPFEFGDNFYSDEELRGKGIHDFKAFAKHFEETQDEERQGQFGSIVREITPKEHPLEAFRMRIFSDAAHALEVVETCGEGSAIVTALELGLRLATNAEAMLSLARAPETLKNPNRKRPPKGRQRHEVKRKKTGKSQT